MIAIHWLVIIVATGKLVIHARQFIAAMVNPLAVVVPVWLLETCRCTSIMRLALLDTPIAN